MSTTLIKPSTIDGVKRLANQLKKSENLPHAYALDAAARLAGYENYAHARRSIKVEQSAGLPGYDLYIGVPWNDREIKTRGIEVLKIRTGSRLDDIVRPSLYREARGLTTMRRREVDYIEDSHVSHSQSRARRDACIAARSIEFMNATGLQPSKARTKMYPGGNYQNRMPGADHDSDWYDPAAKQHVAVTEPYAAAAEHRSERHAAWMAKHGWDIRKTRWGGIYNPDGGCELYLTADRSKGYSLAPLVERLDALPPPIVEENWDGETYPLGSGFESPGAREAKNRKKAQGSAPRKSPAPRNSIAYNMFLSGPSRRPTGRMPLDAHAAIGRLLKGVLVGTEKRAGVHKRANSIRCELDDWVQCEYNHDEMSHEVFSNLYYQLLPDDDPLSLPPEGVSRHIESLEEVKTLLASHYPDSTPLRDMLRKTDMAIASLKTWH